MNSLKAYFGRNTYAMLGECAMCHKPYNGGIWHTYQSDTDDTTSYFILCEECDRKGEQCKGSRKRR